MNSGWNIAKMTAALCRIHDQFENPTEFRQAVQKYLRDLKASEQDENEKFLTLLKQFRGAIIRSRDVEYPQKLRDSYFQKLCKKGWVKRLSYGTYELTESGRAYLLSRGYPDPTCDGWSV